MPISTVFEKLGKAIFEAPFGSNRLSKDAPELAEIRLAVLDAVKAKSHRANGRHVFPYNRVRINLLGVPEEQAGVFRGDFLASYFSQELKAGLSRSNYRFPDDLTAEISTTPALPSPGEQWLSVETHALAPKASDLASSPGSPARLVIVQGTADQPEFTLDKTRTNIGRTAEVFRASGPSRRNDLAFSEDNEINRSVSREHAHIVRSAKSGEYRLFNDRVYKGAENCGLWIVRDGLSYPVHRSARGTSLQDGDEVHFGTAVVRFHSS